MQTSRAHTLSTLFAMLASSMAMACTSIEEEGATGSGQAIAEDELVAAPIPLGPDGEGAASAAPEATHAVTWKTFLVAKKNAPDVRYAVIAAIDAEGKEVYEAVLPPPGKAPRVEFRDPKGRTLALVNKEGRSYLRVGSREVAIDAVLADWEVIVSLLPNDATTTSSLRPLALGDETCAASIGKTIGGAVTALLGMKVAAVSCPGAVLTLGATTAVCAASVLAVVGGGVTAMKSGKQIMTSCKPAAISDRPALDLPEDEPSTTD